MGKVSRRERPNSLGTATASPPSQIAIEILLPPLRADVAALASAAPATLLGSLPVAIFYSLFVDYYVSSLTGAVKE